MSEADYDLAVIGAGPAGMAAALRARTLGLSVVVFDDQFAPGGQIWRGIERAGDAATRLGADYAHGAARAAAFRASGAEYEAGSQVWQIEAGWRIFASRARQARMIVARALVLAIGAMERPAPFEGWTLPGVLTVGAAQILLKTSGQIPDKPVWIAGSGPLPLLYMTQLIDAGGEVAGYLDTTPPGNAARAALRLPAALADGGLADLLKGIGILRKLRQAGVRIVRDVAWLRASGDGRIERLEYRTGRGQSGDAPAELLLIHEGVVPQIHATLSLDCAHVWIDAQGCFAPTLDSWRMTSLPGLFVAGDAGGIAGAGAAGPSGEIAAVGAARHLGRIGERDAEDQALAPRRDFARAIASRPFIDALFAPRAGRFDPPDAVVVCRCEELTAREIRAASAGCQGPNQVKAFTRAGMGPCQGRQCGYTLAHILAHQQGRAPAEIGLQRVRPPLKPVTIGELASLAGEPGS